MPECGDQGRLIEHVCRWANVEGLEAKRLRIAIEGARAIRLGEDADVAGVGGEDGEVVAAGRDGELGDRKRGGGFQDLAWLSVACNSCVWHMLPGHRHTR